MAIDRQEITDNLIDLLIDIVHGIGARAEKKVTQQFIAEFRKALDRARLARRQHEPGTAESGPPFWKSRKKKIVPIPTQMPVRME